MSLSDPNVKFRSADLANRQVAEFIGLSRGVLADDLVNAAEIDFIHKWLVASEAGNENPLLATVRSRIEDALVDGILDDEEIADIALLLRKLVRNDFELGEVLKTTSLPLCSPAPILRLEGTRFCFTGTFTYGSRRVCEAAVVERGGTAGSLTQKTGCLVLGEYVTDSWANETFGRKIERAMEWRDNGHPIAIVCEAHWRGALH